MSAIRLYLETNKCPSVISIFLVVEDIADERL